MLRRERLPALMAGLALIASACATSSEPPPASPEAASLAATHPPLPLRMPIAGVMLGVIDFSSHGLFKIATSEGVPSTQDWYAAGLASLNLIGSSTLITLPGTGDNDDIWVDDPRWRTFAITMQGASVDAGIATRNRDQVALLLAADRLAKACQACHDVFRPELPKVAVTQFASNLSAPNAVAP
jgi:hypothetical protein